MAFVQDIPRCTCDLCGHIWKTAADIVFECPKCRKRTGVKPLKKEGK